MYFALCIVNRLTPCPCTLRLEMSAMKLCETETGRRWQETSPDL